MLDFTDTSYHIVFGCDDNYAKYAAVTMQSIIMAISSNAKLGGGQDNNTQDEHTLDSPQSSAKSQDSQPRAIATLPISFHLLCDTLRPSTQHKLCTLESTLNAHYPCTITLHPQSQEEFSNLTPWGEAGANWCAYFRLKIGDVLDSNIMRCVYLDVDTLVLGDIRELLMSDLGGKAIGAVRNISSDVDIVRDRVVAAQEYCNSGVLLIDLPKWRAKDFTQIQNFAYTRVADQDFVNFIFRGEIHTLPLRWNFQWLHVSRLDFEGAAHRYERDGIQVLPCAYSLEIFTHALRNPTIVHMLGGYKPWEKINFATHGKPIFRTNPYHKHWWRIARKNVFYPQILLPYLKRSANITLSAYTKAYAPILYPIARKLKHLLTRRK
ncbi:glycosyltransferase family 8 protein [uncultured Helicobacter sp.]|uniref:glycosyltransferase family 8 protein n=1 Tax=uncultured Helicobacter sp. TaxID=175537 RepID=UPI00374F6ED2